MLKRRSFLTIINNNTSPNPVMTLVTRSHAKPPLAATGTISVNTDVHRMPRPKVYFPPNLSAKSPPGMCVQTYPQKKELRINPCDSSLQSNKSEFCEGNTSLSVMSLCSENRLRYDGAFCQLYEDFSKEKATQHKRFGGISGLPKKNRPTETAP